MSFPVTHGMARAYQEFLLEEAEKIGSVKITGRTRPGPWVRISVRAGDLLVSAGQWLQRRYEPVIIPPREARQSSC